MTTDQDAERLAQARQQLAANSRAFPATHWDALTDHERKMAILDAANYLKALDAAGFAVIPPDGVVWLVDTESAHEQPMGVFTSEQAAKDAAERAPDLSYSSISLNRIYS